MAQNNSIYHEVNFDGLVGPFHNYGGLSVDNLASGQNRASMSRPREAALQGLQKMKALADAGYKQGVIPPLERPAIHHLRQLGVTGGSDSEILAHAKRDAEHLLMACGSASSMWTANAATVAPSCDTIDGKLHLVIANLFSKLHRSLEADETYSIFNAIFGESASPSLIGGFAMSDEGAANHTRMSSDYSHKGLHIFVYGRDEQKPFNGKFLGRQTRAASEAVARKLMLSSKQCVFLPQSQNVIDLGVFHNDVIAVGNLNCYFYHEDAYEAGFDCERLITEKFSELTGQLPVFIKVPRDKVSVEDAVKTYLFNSQLVGTTESMTLVAPSECREHSGVLNYLNAVMADSMNPVNEVKFFNLKESMRNGGGPACLRLRVVMNESEISQLPTRSILDDSLYQDLTNWVQKHYRESLYPEDLCDPKLLEEVRVALDELTSIMKLGAVYPFQTA